MHTIPGSVEFDPSLMARYDVPAPRYTSYPTAPQFHAGFGEAQLREAAVASNETGAPLSLYVHMPFCWSPCFYCGCTRVITRDVRRADQYLEYLQREIAMTAPLFDAGRTVRQLHFGGGTPNFLDIPRLGDLMRELGEHFRFAKDRGGVEAGIEVDPRFADFDYVCELGALGFNRISIGVQDFDPVVQAAVNRVQTVAQTFEVLEAARAADFDSVNLDLIYGLPRQTLAGFGQTLDQVLGLAPDRVAVYGYAHLPRLFKAQRQIDAADLPDAAMRLRLFGLAVEKLCGAGYVYIGMDHFARPDDELVRAQRQGTLQRNFQGYSTQGDCDIVGLGMSAIGRIGDSYSQNARDLPGYYLALDNGRLPVARGIALDADDVVRRAAINELMCHGVLDMHAFGERHGIVFAACFAEELERLRQLETDGLVELDPETLRVTSRGRLLLRNVAMCFDAYLSRETQPLQPRYARSV
ncbi:MAG: oxygen-independent coproporphyrinogen III oxidase [Xanthomonadales bacterium]|nr:oxygen-independent coproporphyrinogen III oxidase [Xanthomonadales bacterium]ODU94444.1 MAG: oxygen-independent coproporphyrinogen III oxidase [Rhodanobacter sp. SCN 66-43]OJY87052.1 MAG: oxygen-independent coproporphyrinogen III oxidase [Xanthomonadales bacterium 66-474]